MGIGIFRSFLLAGLIAVPGAASYAADYKFGDVDLVMDTTISIGATVRTSQASCDHIGKANGGCSTTEGTDYGPNVDDGNLNYDQWDVVSAVAKVTTDFEARYENYGAFARVKAFYDYIAYEEGPDQTRPTSDSRRGDGARNSAGRGLDLLDAFVYGNFTVAGDLPLTIRAGKQVNNWGESLFIQGGINSYLAYDVTALRTPGSELKEAVLPELSMYASLGLPGNLSVEGWVAFEHTETSLDGCGSFFASSDYVHDGCNYVMFGAEYVEGLADTYDAIGVLIPRAQDADAADGGQYGLSLRYFADWLNDGTDIGLYFVNFHSKAPIYAYQSPDSSAGWGATCAGIVGSAASASAGSAGLCFTDSDVISAGLLSGAASMSYRLEYAEDIRMLGASFNTSIDFLGGTAIAGEIAFSPNMAFQIDSTEMLSMTLDQQEYYQYYAAYLADTTMSADDLAAVSVAQDVAVLSSYGAVAADGTWIRASERTEVFTGQLQTTSTLTGSEPFVDALGADLLILLSNVGFQYLPDVTRDMHLATASSSQIHDDPLVDALLASGTGGEAQYATSSSWGYRLVAIAQYNNFMGTAWTMSPSLQWRHDVNGYSAGPNGPGFVEGIKTVSLGVTGTYQSAYKVNMNYTNSFGNRYRNANVDKDFLTVNVSYAF